MDPFFDPFWNLDQVRAWACARDPEVVRFAAVGVRSRPPQSSLTIAVRSAHAAVRSKQAGRDVNLELWRESGLPMPEDAYIVPMAAERLASELDVPVFWMLTDASLEARFPRCQPTEALLDACSRASKSEREVLLSVWRGTRPGDEQSWLDFPATASLSPELLQRLSDYVNREEVHGPWRLLRGATFPIEEYLLHLFRTGQLTAHANPPGNPAAHLLTKPDWGGLEIAVGGDLRRLFVWRAGRVAISGMGDFENVRVEREEVLREFPEESPLAQASSPPATDDAARAVICQALADRAVSSVGKMATEIVRSKIQPS